MKRLAYLAAVALVGCTSRDGLVTLRDGSYAGSTADRKAIAVDVGGGSIRVDGHPTRRAPGGAFVEEEGARRLLRCREAPGDELRCEVTTGDRTETVELMRL